MGLYWLNSSSISLNLSNSNYLTEFPTMKCPRTNTELKEITIQGIQIDVSEACGGVWFDKFELQNFDESHEVGGDELIQYLEQFEDLSTELSQKINCPRCEHIPLQRHYFSVKKGVEIDECPQCGGVWLDPGELKRIREEYPTEKDRIADGEKYLKKALEQAGLKTNETSNLEQKPTETSVLYRLFQLIRPKALRDEKDELDL